MNWIMGGMDNYAADCFTGMETVYPERWKRLCAEKNCSSLIKRNPTFDKVAVIISGGASNGPLFPGYVADGLADAAVVGAPYAAPNAYTIYETGKHLGAKKGVLLLYNSFAGDYLNNDMAQELLEIDGIAVESVSVNDDIGTAIGEPRQNRNGRCGIALLVKIAGRCASLGMELKEIAGILRRANDRLATLSLKVDFGRNMVIYGNGISGEPGFAQSNNIDIRQAAKESLGYLLEDLKPQSDEKLFLLINRLRLTSYSDSFIMAKAAYDELSSKYDILKTSVANYSNILDIYGFNISVMCVNKETEPFLNGEVCTDSFTL